MLDAMPEPLPTPSAPPYRLTQGKGLATPVAKYWRVMGVRIALFNAHLSLVLAAVSTAFMLLWITLTTPLGPMAATFYGVGLVMVPLTWPITFVVTGLVALVILPCVWLAMRLMGERPPRDTTGLIGGSAVTFVGGVWNVAGMLELLVDPWVGPTAISDGAAVLVNLLSLAIGISAAQAGGMLASLGDLRRRHRGRPPEWSFRLTIWRMMTITAALSVVLGLLSFFGALTAPVGIALLLVLATDVAIHRPVRWATNRWLDWRLERRRKKREERAFAAAAA